MVTFVNNSYSPQPTYPVNQNPGVNGPQAGQQPQGSPRVDDALPDFPAQPGNKAVPAPGVPAPRSGGSEVAPSEADGWSNFSLPISDSNTTIQGLRDQLLLMFLQARKSSLEARNSELESGIKQRLGAVEKGLEAAKQERDAAITAAIGQIVGGAVQGAFAGAAMYSGLKAPSPSQLQAGTASRGVFTLDAQVYTGFGQSLSQISSAGGTISSENQKYEAAQTRADQNRLDIAGEAANTRSQQSDQTASGQLSALQSVIDSLRQAEQLKTDAAKRTFG